MLADVAFIMFHVSTAEPPEVTLVGLAVNESMVGSGIEAGGVVAALLTTTVA
jgi:hypothetical protein